jgi:hypothetical protein
VISLSRLLPTAGVLSRCDCLALPLSGAVRAVGAVGAIAWCSWSDSGCNEDRCALLYVSEVLKLANCEDKSNIVVEVATAAASLATWDKE